jgi:hypothetical protein
MERVALPGEDLVNQGLADLAAGVISAEAFLVSIGAPRLEQFGVAVPRRLARPEHRLYALLARVDSDKAHSRYNALVRRLVSYERALARSRAPA